MGISFFPEKYEYNTTPYFGLDTGNSFAIFGGGIGVAYQIQTNVEIFKAVAPLGETKRIWKQFPQTREDYSLLQYEPSGVFLPEPPSVNPLTAYFNRENLTGGDGVLEMEIIYEVKTI